MRQNNAQQLHSGLQRLSSPAVLLLLLLQFLSQRERDDRRSALPALRSRRRRSRLLCVEQHALLDDSLGLDRAQHEVRDYAHHERRHDHQRGVHVVALHVQQRGEPVLHLTIHLSAHKSTFLSTQITTFITAVS